MKRARDRFRVMTSEQWHAFNGVVETNPDDYKAYVARKSAEQWSLMRKLTEAKVLNQPEAS